MNTARVLTLILGWVLIADTAVRGAEVRHPQGFQFTYSDGWQLATEAQLREIAKGAKASGPAPAVFLFGTPRDGFADNVNVLVVPQVLALDEEHQQSLLGQIQSGIASSGNKLKSFKTQRRQVAGVEALVIALESESSGPGFQTRIWQLYIPGKKQTYIVTCTALKSHWSDAWPSFKQMVESLKIDLPAGK